MLCVRSSGNDEQVALKDEACAVIREKPPVLKSCVKETCPLAWTVGNWSKVKEVSTEKPCKSHFVKALMKRVKRTP